MDYYRIGQQIRKIRKQNGLSQEELAERVNISTTHMSHIETGNTKLSLPVLVDIANALQVTTDELLHNSSSCNPNAVSNEIIRLLENSTPQQFRVLSDILKAAKKAMDAQL